MSASYGQTVVHYPVGRGTPINLGPIYLRDIGMRNQLGGGRGIYVNGQDQYIDYGTDTTFVSTSDVMLSTTKGVIKKLVDTGVVSVEIVADA